MILAAWLILAATAAILALGAWDAHRGDRRRERDE
jgi:hypothetical protein